MSAAGLILHPGADLLTDEDTVETPADDPAWDERVPAVLTAEAETLAALDDQVREVEPLVPVTLFAPRSPAPILPPPIDEGRFVGEVEAPAVLFLVGPAAGGDP